MTDRIKSLRKSLHLTQTEFGERLGVKGNTVTGYENGTRAPSDAIIMAICREFGVNEIWLRTGAGEMFRPEEESEELARNLKRLMNGRPDSLARRAVRVLLRYEPDGPEWQVLEKIYTERFVSRIIGNAQKLDFLGSDIRVRKK